MNVIHQELQNALFVIFVIVPGMNFAEAAPFDIQPAQICLHSLHPFLSVSLGFLLCLSFVVGTLAALQPLLLTLTLSLAAIRPSRDLCIFWKIFLARVR